jgi:TRAP-type C4-dicarboxylate transport system permease small subunit
MVERLMQRWTQVETVLVGLLLILALVVFLGGSALRYFSPAYAIDWADEIASYCIVWATVISGSALMHEKRHITTDLVGTYFPSAVAKVIAFAMVILTLIFCIVMAWYGWEATVFADMLDERSASTLRLPMAWMLFLALPVGMVLMTIRLALMIATGTRSISSETETEEAIIAELKASAENRS